MTPSINLSRLAVFMAVAETMGFTAAANRLGATKAMVSQQVSRLEADLGASLFTRTTRRVVLTDAGQRLYERSAPLLRELAVAADEIGSASKELRGTVRVTASDDYFVHVLGRRLADFLAEHPRVAIDVVASDEIMDMVGGRLDLAIRTGWLRDSSLHAVKLADFDQYVVASPALLDRIDMPKHPHALQGLPWIALTRLRAPLTWSFERGRKGATSRVTPVIRANSSAAVLALAEAGAGMTILADYMVRDALTAGRLRRVLPQWQLPKGGIHVVYPDKRHVPAAVRALIEHLRHAKAA